MKQRLLVMNGQRIVQTEQQGTWINNKVDKAMSLKPGIYNLYTAKEVDKGLKHYGPIVHADNNKIYQQSGKNLIIHNRQNFDKVPEIGSLTNISYGANEKAIVSTTDIKKRNVIKR